MGYFSNGTEGDMYENDYCRVCIHRPSYWRVGDDGTKDCPVLTLHSAWNYEQELNDKEKQKTDPKFIALSLLIPRITLQHTLRDGKLIDISTNAECAFFVDEKRLRDEIKNSLGGQV